ncbi:transcription termination factor MTERF15, mitochondrial-like [Quercus lobata]|uniref:transcription termination factor MTERF15, mitochondrial-like n=1 Tax=Quercus lobata TaxID=97700 RepID=UPI0012469748|nr:transcription termination factor MTERF15, mitochondrial-like [Quercus lobata]XP_030955602.1 transcription termination factor MTERF15, mitochondrial-like [Quercus lobata]
MGFNPLKFSFIQAVFAMVGMNKSTWERKVNVYKRWDLSQEEILAAFRKCPSCIIASEDKIMQVVDFYVNKTGFETSFIVNRPILIIYSLEKRLIPRASVIEVLQSKGLIKKNIHLARVFSTSENSFLQKFVTPYMDEVSDLLKLYKGKLDFSKMTTK